MIQPGRIGLDITIAEVLGNTSGRQQLDLVTRCQRRQIVLETLDIDFAAVSRAKLVLTDELLALAKQQQDAAQTEKQQDKTQ